MTTYSKLCPKCQHACDMSAVSCKRCGLRFGAPVETAASRPNQAAPSRRVLIVLGVVGVLLLLLVVQIVGDTQEKARRKKEAQYNSWENVQRRMNSGAGN